MRLTTARCAQAFDRICQSGLTHMVGAGDPAAVGFGNLAALGANLELRDDLSVLDFGCGIGRSTVAIADHLTRGQVVGVDIVPAMIEFCNTAIAPLFPNASFLLSSNTNPLFEKFMGVTALKSQPFEDWARANPDRFDLICAFSVFTHLDEAMTASTLEALFRVLKPDGVVYMTCFLDAPDNSAVFRLSAGEQFKDCHAQDPMERVVYSASRLLELARAAGFSVSKLLFGHWRDGVGVRWMKGGHYQDALLLHRPIRLPADFDPKRYVALNPDLDKPGVDGSHHYIAYGFKESRRYR